MQMLEQNKQNRAKLAKPLPKACQLILIPGSGFVYVFVIFWSARESGSESFGKLRVPVSQCPPCPEL